MTPPLRGLAVASALLCAAAVQAQTKPFASWLADAADAPGSRIEVWASGGAAGAPRWRLLSPTGTTLAAMDQPALPAGYTVNFGQCRIEGRLRNDVLAIVRHRKNQEWSSELQSVWIASASRAAFVPIDGKGVQCRNEGHGV